MGSFPTPYIPTVAASATRNADVITVPDIDTSECWNPSEGTFVVEFEKRVGTVLAIGQGTFNTSLLIGGEVNLIRATGTGFPNTVVVGGATPVNQRVKLACVIKENDYRVSVNGGVVVSDTSGSAIPSPTRIDIGNGYGVGFINGNIYKILYSRKAVSDARLQELSTL